MPGADSDIDMYYRKFFPHATACKMLGRAWRGSSSLHLRELCIETKEQAYIRWQCVSSPEELKELFATKNVERFHTGAIFDEQPRYKKKGVALTPTHREFVVDIDVNDYTTWGADRPWSVVGGTPRASGGAPQAVPPCQQARAAFT